MRAATYTLNAQYSCTAENSPAAPIVLPFANCMVGLSVPVAFHRKERAKNCGAASFFFFAEISPQATLRFCVWEFMFS